MNKKEMQFTVFLIHAIADEYGKDYDDIYRSLNNAEIIDGYIIPCYDVLHTLGEKYLVEDITDFAKEKGVYL